MGGEGFMLHMINTLRDNRGLLRRKGMFKRKQTFLTRRKEYYKASQGNFIFKELSKDELKAIRRKVLKQRRKDSIIQWSIFLILSSLIFFMVSFFFIEDPKPQETESNKDKHLKDYFFYIQEGDKWIGQRNWDNAIFEYKIAQKHFPKKYEINYRLALAYSYNCKFELKDCKKATALIDKLLVLEPKDTTLLKIKTEWIRME